MDMPTSGDMPAENTGAFEGVIAFLDTATGDGRVIDSAGFGWRQLPLTLMAQFENEPGHMGAEIVGKITDIWVEGKVVKARGKFSACEEGQKAREMLKNQELRGVSVDLADVEVDFESDPNFVHFTKCRVGAATMTPVPAFADAVLSITAASGEEMFTASFEFNPEYADCECDFATTIPVEPPVEWFKNPNLDKVTPLVVDRNGRVYGHVSEWGACHIGYGAVCREVPRGGTYKKFMNKSVECSNGEIVPTGPIVIAANHAKPFETADVAQDHYAHTGCAVADVAVFEDEFGLVVAGALRPTVDGVQVRVLRGSDISPDWRKVRTTRNRAGKWEMVGLLAVNTSGFLSDSLLASAGDEDEFVFEQISEPRIGIDDEGLVSFVGGNIVFRSSNDIVVNDSGAGSNIDEVKEPVIMPKLDVAEVEVKPVLSDDFVAQLSSVISDAIVAAFASVKATVDTNTEVVEDEAVVASGEVVSETPVEAPVDLSEKVAQLASDLAVVKDFVDAQKAAQDAVELKNKYGAKFNI